MPGRKGVLAPQNSFLDTIATRFDGTQSCFLLGSAQVPGVYRIVYCSDGFCTLTGHPRAQVMQKSCSCDFLFGDKTARAEQARIWRSLSEKTEFKSEITLYKKAGATFECLLDIVPIRNQNRGVVMFLVSLKDVSPQQPESTDEQSGSEKPFVGTTEEISANKKDSNSSWHSMTDSNHVSCIPAQRRRSRAVLYNLSGHIDGTSGDSRINSCATITNIFSGTKRQALEYKTNFADMKSHFTILHYSIAKTAWDWLILTFTLYVAAVVPYYAALQALDPTYVYQNYTFKDYMHYPTYAFDIFIEFVFILDIALNFRTTYVDKRGQLVSSSSEIALNYLKSTFIIDLIAAIPLDVIGHVFAASWGPIRTPIQLLKIVRLLRVFKLYKKIDSWSQCRIVVLLMLMLMFGMVAHWMACIWFSIGWTEFNKTPIGTTDGTGWIFELSEAMHRPIFANKTGGPGIQSAYLTSLYFTLSSLTSVGFGNVSANTNAEKMFSICVMIVGAIMHAVVFGSITAIIQRMCEKRSEFDRKERNLTDFTRIHRFPKDLKRRMLTTFQGKWAMNKGVNEKEVVNEFPEDMQADIAIHLHRDLLNLPVFRKTGEGCRRFASLHSSRRFVAPTNNFIHAGDPLEYVFLVCSGSLEVSKNDIVSAILSKGDLFGGDVASNTVVISQANVKALTFCELQCISLVGLKKIAEIYPQQCDIMQELRADFSCQLWEETILDMKAQKQRTTKIESWHRHYNEAAKAQSSETSESDSSCVYYPAITVRPPSPNSNVATNLQEAEYNIEAIENEENNETEGKWTHSQESVLDNKSFLDTTGASPINRVHKRPQSRKITSDYNGSPCSLLQVNGWDSFRKLKKRVSFHDEEEMNEAKQGDGGDASNVKHVIVNEIPGGDALKKSLEETLSSAPESPYSPTYYSSFENYSSRSRGGSDCIRFAAGSDKERITSVDGARVRNGSPKVTQFQYETTEDISAKSFPLPGCPNDTRKKRRRRKAIPKFDPKDRKTSSSSVEEELVKVDYAKERHRKISAPELVPKEEYSVNYPIGRKQQSPQRTSPERHCRLQKLEEKFDSLHIMVSSMAANVDHILLQLHELVTMNAKLNHKPNEFSKKAECTQVPSRYPRPLLRHQRSNSSQDIHGTRSDISSCAFGYSSLGNLRKLSDVAKPVSYVESPEETIGNDVNGWKRPIPRRFENCSNSSNRADSSFRILIPSRECSPVPDQGDLPRSFDMGQTIADGNTVTPSVIRPRYVGDSLEHRLPDKIHPHPLPNDRSLHQPALLLTSEDGISPCRDASTAYRHCEDGNSAAQVLCSPRAMSTTHTDTLLNGPCDYIVNTQSRMILQTNIRRHIPLPTIEVSNYDGSVKFEEGDSAPIGNHSVRHGMNHLSIPMKRHGGGSESGYSTSSPSPDIHIQGS